MQKGQNPPTNKRRRHPGQKGHNHERRRDDNAVDMP